VATISVNPKFHTVLKIEAVKIDILSTTTVFKDDKDRMKKREKNPKETFEVLQHNHHQV
jgi:hypothetical protein